MPRHLPSIVFMPGKDLRRTKALISGRSRDSAEAGSAGEHKVVPRSMKCLPEHGRQAPSMHTEPSAKMGRCIGSRPLSPTLQKYKGHEETTMNNCMPTNEITYMKWANS